MKDQIRRAHEVYYSDSLVDEHMSSHLIADILRTEAHTQKESKKNERKNRKKLKTVFSHQQWVNVINSMKSIHFKRTISLKHFNEFLVKLKQELIIYNETGMMNNNRTLDITFQCLWSEKHTWSLQHPLQNTNRIWMTTPIIQKTNIQTCKHSIFFFCENPTKLHSLLI